MVDVPYISPADQQMIKRLAEDFYAFRQRVEVQAGQRQATPAIVVISPASGIGIGETRRCDRLRGTTDANDPQGLGTYQHFKSLAPVNSGVHEVEVTNVAHSFIRGGVYLVCVWASIDGTGGWVVAGFAGQTVWGGTVTETNGIPADSFGDANLEHLSDDVAVDLDWAHGGEKVSLDKEIIVVDRGENYLIISAECEDPVTPIADVPTLLRLQPTNVLFDSTSPTYFTAGGTDAGVVSDNEVHITFRALITANPGAAQTIMDMRDSASDGIRVGINTSGKVFATVNGTTATHSTAMTPNTWHEFEIVYDQVNVSVNMDAGTPDTTAETSAISVATAFRVGCNSFNTSNGFDGYIDWVRVGITSGDTERIHWEFLERSGTTVRDDTDNQYGITGTGTNIDATAWAGGKVSTTPTIEWDSDGDEWDVYFGTATTFTFRETITSQTWSPGTLDAATEYFFLVKARNAIGTTVGPYCAFTTA